MKTKKENSGILTSLLEEIDPRTARNIEKKMALAARIADLMEAKGISKTKLANILNKHPSEISKWISGTHNFTSETLWDIEEALDAVIIKLDDRVHLVQFAKLEIRLTSEVPTFSGNKNIQNIFIDNPSYLIGG